MIRRLLLCFALAAALPAGAVTLDQYQFDSDAERERYRELIAELRCLVCQNQNLASSNADLAQDLRRQTYELMQQGKSDAEIIEYLVARYGDFVRYSPPVEPGTYLLWFGPATVFLVSVILGVRWIRRQERAAGETMDEYQRRRAAELLGEQDNDDEPRA